MRKLQTFLVLGLFMASSCTVRQEAADTRGRIELVRTQHENFNIVARGFKRNIRALQFELSVESANSFIVSDAKAASGLPLDSVHTAVAGQNHSRFFIGDKRGIRLRQDGVLATFQLLRTSGGQENGRLKLETIKIADDQGNMVPVDSGPSIYIQ